MMNFTNKLNDLSKLCAQYDVKQLCVFGSSLTDDFTQESDIDFLVTFHHPTIKGSFDRYFDLKDEL
ncbi:MAG: nucleotidyltransferase domain-containing protein, partial [SAR324 cluster bacterium]|nr:nucleotidyltransferase domain-containing protein [SAR324 cluster bacterium]